MVHLSVKAVVVTSVGNLQKLHQQQPQQCLEAPLLRLIDATEKSKHLVKQSLIDLLGMDQQEEIQSRLIGTASLD